MSPEIGIDIFRGDWIALTRIWPCFIVADCPRMSTGSCAGWPFYLTTAILTAVAAKPRKESCWECQTTGWICEVSLWCCPTKPKTQSQQARKVSQTPTPTQMTNSKHWGGIFRPLLVHIVRTLLLHRRCLCSSLRHPINNFPSSHLPLLPRAIWELEHSHRCHKIQGQNHSFLLHSQLVCA